MLSGERKTLQSYSIKRDFPLSTLLNGFAHSKLLTSLAVLSEKKYRFINTSHTGVTRKTTSTNQW